MTDRLDRLERHLDEVLAGPRRLMRSLSKTTTGTDAMTTKPETVAAVLDMLDAYCYVPVNWGRRHDNDEIARVRAQLESALTKAEAVAEVPRDPVERYLFDALKQYPSKNPQRTQAAKICAGVLKRAREMADNDVENWQ